MSTSFELEIVPLIAPWVRCVLALRADATLDALHARIADAFRLPELPGYAFFMNGDLDGDDFHYGPAGTFARYASESATLAGLSLVVNKRFLHAFDDDEACALEVRVLRIVEGEPASGLLTAEGDLGSVYAGDESEGDEARPGGANDDDEAPSGSAPVDPSMAKLARDIAPRFERWVKLEKTREQLAEGGASSPSALRERPGEAVRDAALVQDLLERTSSDVARVHAAVDPAIGTEIWSWIFAVPERLSDAGDHDRAASLSQLVDAVVLAARKHLRLPLYLARAGRRDEALAQLERNFAEYPEDMDMLRGAGEAFVALGEHARGESVLREAIRWSGGNLSARAEAVQALMQHLIDRGRLTEAEALVDDETARLERLADAQEADA